jgi:tRNA-Thr(GGU) m(6)t(6)A37 methyltransferase TsaA
MTAGHGLVVEPIGVVRSALRSRKNAPRHPSEGAPDAVLDLEERFAPALKGVRVGIDLVVITWLHLGAREVLQVHPGRDEDRPLTGVFATRSPDRPNPIGIHRVTVTAIDPPARVHVAALEAIDGTPILDLKVAFDSKERLTATVRLTRPNTDRGRALSVAPQDEHVQKRTGTREPPWSQSSRNRTRAKGSVTSRTHPRKHHRTDGAWQR